MLENPSQIWLAMCKEKDQTIRDAWIVISLLSGSMIILVGWLVVAYFNCN